jgi:hypothetical protein
VKLLRRHLKPREAFASLSTPWQPQGMPPTGSPTINITIQNITIQNTGGFETLPGNIADA